MANLNAVSVPTAIGHKTKLDLSFDHVTSMGFMRCQPVLYRRMIRGEHDMIKCDANVRPAPIEVPFFGSLVMNIRYFAVKLSTIFPNWYSFINDNIASNVTDSSLVSDVPRLPNKSLMTLFTSVKFNSDYYNDPSFIIGLFYKTAKYFSSSRTIAGVSYPAGWYTSFDGHIGPSVVDNDLIVPFDASDDDNFDYQVGDYIYILGHIGRRYMTLLNCLGYRVIWTSSDKNDILPYNALNLLAFARVFIDWYCNSQYLNTYSILYIEKLFKYNDPTGFLSLSAVDVHVLLNITMHVVYDTDDYFVNAYDNPTSAVSGQFSGFSVFDPSSTGGAYVQTNANGTPEMTANSSYPLSVGTTYIHEALKRLTDYQKRHQLSARSIDRALAQYGAVPTILKNERSIYLGHQPVVIKSGAVMATGNGTTSSGNSSTVGDYAGAGFGQGSDSIEYLAEDDCIILGLASIIPQGNMVQGYDRCNRALSKFDFYQPELDFGVKAIEKGEVYVSKRDSFAGVDSDGVSLYANKFGFTGQYGELKRPKSMLTGDLANTRLMRGASSWHLFRMFDDHNFSDNVSNVEHSVNFTRGIDEGQYYRIFQYVGDDYDPFYCFFHFDFAAISPCRPLFDTYDFEEDAGKKVDISNGNKVN